MAFDMKLAIKHTEAVAAAAKTELACVAVFVFAIHRVGNDAHATSAAVGAEDLPMKLGDAIRSHLADIDQ